MKAKDNTVYILSSCYRGDQLMYAQKFGKSGYDATLKLCKAKVFSCRAHAKYFLDNHASFSWQVQPILSKIIFEARLKGI